MVCSVARCEFRAQVCAGQEHDHGHGAARSHLPTLVPQRAHRPGPTHGRDWTRSIEHSNSAAAAATATTTTTATATTTTAADANAEAAGAANRAVRRKETSAFQVKIVLRVMPLGLVPKHRCVVETSHVHYLLSINTSFSIILLHCIIIFITHRVLILKIKIKKKYLDYF